MKKNRVIFDIESTNGKVKYNFNKKVVLTDGALLYLLGDIVNLILGSFSEDSDSEIVHDIFNATIKLLDTKEAFLIGDFNFKYEYREDKMNGFTKYAPLSLAHISSIIYNRSNIKNKLSESSYLRASLSFYDFCSDNNINWSKLFFLKDKQIKKIHPILKKDLPIRF